MSEVFDVTPSADGSGAEQDQNTAGLSTPIEYLVETARRHQIVMLGDRRGVAQHLATLRGAIGPLHAAGIRTLAWEFTNSRCQTDLDQLTRAAEWNRDKCIDLFVDLLGIGHGYEDYLSVVEAVWRFNAGRSAGEPPFRMVALGLPTYVEDPDLLDGRSAGETGLRNWWMGGHYRDVSAWHMANTITAEILRHGERAVVYADAHRTNTRFVEWIDGLVSTGPGNLIHNWVGEGVARVLFHGAVDDEEAVARVEQLVASSPDPESAFGLDLDTSTLGNVRLLDLEGSAGPEHRRISLSNVADGYLFVAPIKAWEPARLIEDFLTPSRFETAERSYRALDPRDTPYSLDELEAVRAEGATTITDQWPAGTAETSDDISAPKRRFRRSRG